jgi:hypothetical protein
MITRLSKIARLPANIREELNRRLHDGKLSSNILPWVNNLPETKEILAQLFGGKPITHQNLSEWRRAGYQDWLFHQQRLAWFDRLTEEEAEIKKHDDCEDTFEALSNYFVYEIAQGIRALQQIKNPFERMERMQHLAREFARLQNAYNWSRRVELDFAKHKPTRNAPAAPSVSLGPPVPRRQDAMEREPLKSPAPSPTPASNSSTLKLINSQAPQPVPASSDPSSSRREEAQTPSSFSIQPSAFPKCQPLPTLATPTPPPRPLKGVHIPQRGRRFICIEG